MALTSCPECKKEISTVAEACPHCGYKTVATPPPAGPAAKSGFPVWAIVLSVVAVLGVLAIAVIAIMAAVTIPKLTSAIDKAKTGAAAGDIGAFNSALALYQVDVASQAFPATLHQLYYDNAPGWSGPYMATIAPDPWNNQYQYISDGQDYTLQSVHKSANGRAETIRYILSRGVMESMP